MWFFAEREWKERRQELSRLKPSRIDNWDCLEFQSLERRVTIEMWLWKIFYFFWHAYDNFSSPHQHLIQIKNSFILPMLPCCPIVYSLPPAIKFLLFTAAALISKGWNTRGGGFNDSKHRLILISVRTIKLTIKKWPTLDDILSIHFFGGNNVIHIFTTVPQWNKKR